MDYRPLVILLFGFLGASVLFGFYMYTENMDLEDKLNALTIDYNELQAKYSSLQKNYQELQSNYDYLQSRYNSLENEYESFKQAYKNIVDSIIDRAGDDSNTWSSYFDYNSYEVNKATNQALSKWLGNPYSKIYDWVKDNIKYNYDTPLAVLSYDPNLGVYWEPDYWKKASETIEDGYGDCEDQAILVASMVMNYWQREYNHIYDIYVVLASGPKGGHAFTIIPVKGDKIIILDPAGSQITGLDLWIFRIVDAEDIGNALNNYFETWKAYGYEFTNVYAVFNQKGYQILNKDPIDFIVWLYQETTD